MKPSVAESFNHGTVLVTGSTGFLGKLLIEKLLRSCSVSNIAIIVRSKKGLNAYERVADIYNKPLFDRLRNQKPDFMNNIKVIDGDLILPSMGISSTDRKWLVENVNFVFHCAATIKFNESLKMAIKINIQGTEQLLELAAQMRNLKGFVNVSTAYSHCPRKEIREEYYPVHITAKELTNEVDSDKLTNKIIANWPNAYTLTKAITENLISSNVNNLPISIFRPSIIGCTKSEPEPGWLENMNGPSGVIAGFMTGFLRTAPNVRDNVTDIIPADFTVNAMISVMWDTVNRYQDSNLIDKKPKIYNYISSVESPLTWDRYVSEMYSHYSEAPPLKSIWYTFHIIYINLWLGTILRFLLHWIPAAFMDFSLLLCGKTPIMLKMYAKTHHMIDLLYEFTTRQWKFDNSNTRELWSSMSRQDQITFNYSLDEFDWKPYLKSYYFGIRKHLLYEDQSNIKEAKAKNRKLFWLHYITIFSVTYTIFKLCCWLKSSLL